jgi:hypothetical protein
MIEAKWTGVVNTIIADYPVTAMHDVGNTTVVEFRCWGSFFIGFMGQGEAIVGRNLCKTPRGISAPPDSKRTSDVDAVSRWLHCLPFLVLEREFQLV